MILFDKRVSYPTSIDYVNSMKVALSCLFSFFTFWAVAQYDPAKVNRKAATLFEQAIAKAQADQYQESLQLLQQAIKADSQFEDGYLSIAGIYGESRSYDSAIKYYERARVIDSNYFKEYNLPYSINLAGKGHFEKALQVVNEFLSIKGLNEKSLAAAQYRKNCYSFAIAYAQEHQLNQYDFRPVNMGPAINSPVSEYYPALTIDKHQLIFTRRVNNYNEDFFGSTLSKEGQWAPAQGLAGNINTNSNEGAQSISQDGQLLVFTGCNFPKGMGSCDLYISFATPEGWSTPENLGPEINTEYWESAPSLSPNKKDLYFASKRPDGYGGSDIYVSHLQSNGMFGVPELLGPEVNTAGDESSPFIHADNETLYFTSNGHPGYGGDDLFVSRKKSGSSWTHPTNLGYPVNTIENEGSLVVAADGKTAYYASDRSEGYGGLDLYTFELRKEIRPTRTLWVKGRVTDKRTMNGLPATVELAEIKTKSILNRIPTDEEGYYLITLPVGKDYAFNVNRKGYLFYSENFSLQDKAADSTYTINIPLQPLEANALVVLRNIFFDTNAFELKAESFSELEKILQVLQENPSIKVEISGHTDNTGNAEENSKLSILRANAVVRYLIDKGISRERLVAKGYGDTQPIATNNTSEGRAQNRRTQLIILSR
ncbi:MAG: hypothetical protein RL732_1356 [Bacteroidota bacterium]